MLQQNYPNPFNSGTAIEFSLPRSGHVTLKLYDAVGVEVATLIDENLSAEKQKIVWNAQGFTSGIYFYRLQAGEWVETKKLLLIK